MSEPRENPSTENLPSSPDQIDSKDQWSDLQWTNVFFLAFVAAALIVVGTFGYGVGTVFLPLLWALACLAVGAFI
jgi:hypothetical protein